MRPPRCTHRPPAGPPGSSPGTPRYPGRACRRRWLPAPPRDADTRPGELGPARRPSPHGPARPDKSRDIPSARDGGGSPATARAAPDGDAGTRWSSMRRSVNNVTAIAVPPTGLVITSRFSLYPVHSNHSKIVAWHAYRAARGDPTVRFHVKPAPQAKSRSSTTQKAWTPRAPARGTTWHDLKSAAAARGALPRTPGRRRPHRGRGRRPSRGHRAGLGSSTLMKESTRLQDSGACRRGDCRHRSHGHLVCPARLSATRGSVVPGVRRAATWRQFSSRSPPAH